MIERLRKLHASLTEAVRRVLLPAALGLVYFAGIGLTWVLVRLFKPGVLGRRAEAESFWQTAEGYAPDEEDCLGQS